jgi:hypothetical protein
LTTAFNNNNGVVNIDVGSWDYVDMQVVTPSGAITFNGTNDGGEITGVTDGNALSAKNWNNVLGKNLATGSTATSTNASSTYQFAVTTKFLQFTSSGATVAELLVWMYKIMN